MPANFLHGVETVDVLQGPVPVREVKSAVIALVGIAPTGPVNELTLCTSATDDAQFGAQVPGFNIPQALAAIRANGGGTVLVVNTFSITDNTDPVTAETKTITDGKATLAYSPVPNLAAHFTLTNATGATTYVYGTDYTVSDFGVVTVLNFAAIAEGSTVKATYKRLNGTEVTNAQLIGTITNGVRTGCKLFEIAYNTFGFRPKLLIAPGYSHIVAVRNELISMADKFKAVVFVDAGEESWDPADAITDRGVSGDQFNTSSDRVYLLYPGVKAYSPYHDADEVRPASAHVAGLVAKTDRDLGYWYSPSNKELRGVTGVQRITQWELQNADCEANLLNEAGISTFVSGFGTGIRLWGNRTAAWPSQTSANNFLSVRRVADMLTESIEYSMLQFLDRPGTPGTIEAIRETCNAFIRTLIQRGALVDGECLFLAEDNPPTKTANGHYTFRLVFMPPTPMERITFLAYIDTSMLRALA